MLRRAQELREAIHRVYAAHAAGAPAPRRQLDRLNHHLADALMHARVGEQGGAFAGKWEGAPDARTKCSGCWPGPRPNC
jgi:hypothetical protein